MVLFNLGGPDGPQAVRPFLFNLFDDPAIIGAPGPVRWLIATLIALRRAPVARAIYDKIGGRSPIREETEAQAGALERRLGPGTKVFVAMRYWHPRATETVEAVKAYAPEDVVLLPLYPQFSTTTTASSLAEWRKVAAARGLDAPTRSLCCYPDAEGFVAAAARLIAHKIDEAAAQGHPAPRLLLSAHGLPKRIVGRGDPYPWQVERTAAAIVRRLGRDGLDWRVCYQSRVGPLEWIGPATDAEIVRAGAEGKALVVSSIAFVSEHSETLVELDIEYARLARERGVPCYLRVPAVGTAGEFVEALAALVEEASARDDGAPEPCAAGGVRICPAAHGRCAMARGGAPR